MFNSANDTMKNTTPDPAAATLRVAGEHSTSHPCPKRQHRFAKPQRRIASRLTAGFSLVEILLSLGIFAIGVTAIVSLFPAAAILQRETTQEVIGDMAAQSAAAIVNIQQMTYAPPSERASFTGLLDLYHPDANSTNRNAFPLHAIAIPGGTALDRFPATDRSYPTASLNLADPTNFNDVIADCDLYWVPFIQDISGNPANPNWIMRLFVLEADSRADYPVNSGNANPNDPTSFPKVQSIGVNGLGNNADGVLSVFNLAGAVPLEPGDIVMDNNGNDHVIVNIAGNQIEVLNPIARAPDDPVALWYAPPGNNGTSSPAQRVITIDVNVFTLASP